MEEPIRASVVGGMNLDIVGTSRETLRERDSNIGFIGFAPGGVGRNIAERLALSGAKTRLFTCVAEDMPGRMLENDCARKGIDLNFALRAKGRSPCYMSLHGADGDMVLALNDMALMDSLTPRYLARVTEEIQNADVCVLDANIPEDSARFLSESVRVPLVADAVSAAKADRLAGALSKLAALKVNLVEARALTGTEELESAARTLLKKGVKRVFISLGEGGTYYADGREAGTIPISERFSCQTTGAGDAMCAGIALGAAKNECARECALRGMAMSAAFLRARSEEKESRGSDFL